jgi:hypothetical protein
MDFGWEAMIKTTYFDTYSGQGWPEPEWLARYFLTSRGRRDFFASGNDNWGLAAEGVDGTHRLPARQGRADVDLTIQGHPDLGVLLQWQRTGRIPIETYYSRGDLTKLMQWVKDTNGYRHSVGLFIPFETAWLAIKEFMERDGALPSAIKWIRSGDIPKEVFPPP